MFFPVIATEVGLPCSIFLSVISFMRKMWKETSFHSIKKYNWTELILQFDLLIVPDSFLLSCHIFFC